MIDENSNDPLHNALRNQMKLYYEKLTKEIERLEKQIDILVDAMKGILNYLGPDYMKKQYINQ